MQLPSINTRQPSLAIAILGLLVFGLTPGMVQGAANIVIQVGDGANEGFNDPTPTTAVGGNEGTTLGAQRLRVFQAAAENWARFIDSDVTINVSAKFDPLTCNSYSAVLGSAGPRHVNVITATGARADTWYSVAQANALEGRDLNGAEPEVVTQFNSSIDNNNSCLNNINWYYGIDGNAPRYSIDLLAVVMHEIGHGIGFLSLIGEDGSIFYGREDIYSVFLTDASTEIPLLSMVNNAERQAALRNAGNLVWTGTQTNAAASGLTQGLNNNRVQMYAPTTYRRGSSVSHFDTAVTPHELMEPFSTGPKDDPGLAVQLMHDLGWPDSSEPVNTPPTLSDIPVNQDVLVNHAPLSLSFSVADAQTSLDALVVSAESMDQDVLPNANLVVSAVDNSNGQVNLTLNYALNTQGAANVRLRVADEAGEHTDAFFQYKVSQPADEPEGPAPDAPAEITPGVLTQFDNIVRRYEAEYAEYENSAARLTALARETARLYETWRVALQDVAATDSATRAGSIALAAAAVAENRYRYQYARHRTLIDENNIDVERTNQEIRALNALITTYALEVTPIDELTTTDPLPTDPTPPTL